jgi:hypothetical protein
MGTDHKDLKRVKKKLSTKAKVWIGVIFITTLIIAFGIVNENISKKVYLKDRMIVESCITQIEKDDGKNYVQVATDYKNIKLTEDNAWIEVTDSFLAKTNDKGRVGIALENYDVYKPKYWGVFGSGQTYESSYWAVGEIYESYDLASKDNPTKDYINTGMVKKKKLTQKGDSFFVIEAEERNFTVQIAKSIYDKYKVNDTVYCKFKSVGDMVKLYELIE